MKITIKTTNLELTPSLRSYVKEKIGSLEKFIQKLDDPVEKGKPSYEAWVEIGRTTHHHHKGKVFRAECQIRFPRKGIRAESTRSDLHLAIDEVRNELQEEIKRYLSKKTMRYRRVARKMKKFIRISPLARFRK